MKSRSQGFTLIELMIAITVLSILFAVALPSYREFTRNNRVTAAQNDLVTAFTYARSEALRQSTPVTVCASADGDTCSGTSNWATGWIAFTDASGTAAQVNTPDDEVLQRWDGLNVDMKLEASEAFVRYAASGMIADSPAVSSFPVTFDIHARDCAGPKLRHVEISPVGSLASTKQDCPPA